VAHAVGARAATKSLPRGSNPFSPRDLGLRGEKYRREIQFILPDEQEYTR